MDELTARKRASVGQLLFKCARLMNEQALERVRRAGGPELRPAHTALFPHIDLEGTRLTELARRVGVSKQAVAQLVDELVERGVLDRIDDPDDGRAKRIRFSRAKGRTVLDGLAQLGEFEVELAAEVGAARMRALHDALLALHDVLESRDAQRAAAPSARGRRASVRASKD